MKAWLEQLGKPGLAGIGLLMFCVGFIFGHLLPQQDELRRLAGEVETLAATRDETATQMPTRQTTTAEQPLLPLATAPEQLKQLHALASRHGIVIERATYQIKAEKARAGQMRLEVSMPLNLGYPVLRAYLRDVLSMPLATLEDLVLQRAQATDQAIEAQLRLSFGVSLDRAP